MEIRQIVVRLSIVLSFYIVGAYGTTDILRLLKGNSIDINSKDCFCSICNNKIKLVDQVPIFAYILRHGKCRYCGGKIPYMHFVIETILFLALSITSIVLKFRLYALGFCAVIYELIKAICICIYGKRENCFTKNIMSSIVNNVVVFSLIFSLFLFAQL